MSITLKQLEKIVSEERGRWDGMMKGYVGSDFNRIHNNARRNAAVAALMQVLQDAIAADNKETI